MIVFISINIYAVHVSTIGSDDVFVVMMSSVYDFLEEFYVIYNTELELWVNATKHSVDYYPSNLFTLKMEQNDTEQIKCVCTNFLFLSLR